VAYSYLDGAAAQATCDDLNDWCRANCVHVTSPYPGGGSYQSIGCGSISTGPVSAVSGSITYGSPYNAPSGVVAVHVLCGHIYMGPYTSGGRRVAELKCPLDAKFQWINGGVCYRVEEAELFV
jgi:hypothetical protein